MRRRKQSSKQKPSDQLLVCAHCVGDGAPMITTAAAGKRTNRQSKVKLTNIKQLLIGAGSLLSSSLLLLIVAQDSLLVHSQQQTISPANPWQQQQQQIQSPANVDFSRLAQLFQLRPPASLSLAGHDWTAAADPNNRTTMRFFRNNKTFASIVYANEQSHSTAGGVATQQLFAIPQQQQQQLQQQQQNSNNQKQNALNRLINCHLVDLEKHATDVALFEAKYSIRTVDIEFADMMHLIEACTEIARLRMPPINRLAAAGPQSNATGGAGNSAVTLSVGQKPLLVVGRPIPVMGPSGQSQSQPQSQPQSQLQSQSQPIGAAPGAAMTTTSSSPAMLTLSTTISSARSANEPPLSIQDSVVSTRSRRRIGPQTQGTGQQTAEQNQHQHQHQHHQHQHQHQHSKQQQQQDHRLTIGEVTPPANLVVNGKLREAIQEITSYDTSDLMSIWRGILPGTNWCGMGDRATSYNDLGFESDIDICCRAHDFCPIRLSAFSSGYGLFNWSFYTRSHCRCDQNFLDCLRRAESPLASVVLKFYFAIMKTTCLNNNQTVEAAADSGASFTLSVSPNALSAGSSSNSRGINNMASNNNSNNRKLLAGSRLFEQLRAKLPIPRAIERSQVLLSKLDTKPKQQAQMQQRYGQQRSIGGGATEPS